VEASFSWQIQFVGDFDPSVEADLYELDAFDADTAVIGWIHDRGGRAICYVNAGAWEDWRTDSGAFPADIVGLAYEGWPGERWLDIREWDALAPILQSRVDLCVRKGFSGVEFDNVDGYQNDTGFDITAADQLAFNHRLAVFAHGRGLTVGLKNDPDQAAALAGEFDFSVVENCFSEGWCGQLQPFLADQKPVLAIEYGISEPLRGEFCRQAAEAGIHLIFKSIDLDAMRETCP
jgi:hypothetical protein